MLCTRVFHFQTYRTGAESANGTGNVLPDRPSDVPPVVLPRLSTGGTTTSTTSPTLSVDPSFDMRKEIKEGDHSIEETHRFTSSSSGGGGDRDENKISVTVQLKPDLTIAEVLLMLKKNPLYDRYVGGKLGEKGKEAVLFDHARPSCLVPSFGRVSESPLDMVVRFLDCAEASLSCVEDCRVCKFIGWRVPLTEPIQTDHLLHMACRKCVRQRGRLWTAGKRVERKSESKEETKSNRTSLKSTNLSTLLTDEEEEKEDEGESTDSMVTQGHHFGIAEHMPRRTTGTGEPRLVAKYFPTGLMHGMGSGEDRVFGLVRLAEYRVQLPHTSRGHFTLYQAPEKCNVASLLFIVIQQERLLSSPYEREPTENKHLDPGRVKLKKAETNDNDDEEQGGSDTVLSKSRRGPDEKKTKRNEDDRDFEIKKTRIGPVTWTLYGVDNTERPLLPFDIACVEQTNRTFVLRNDLAFAIRLCLDDKDQKIELGLQSRRVTARQYIRWAYYLNPHGRLRNPYVILKRKRTSESATPATVVVPTARSRTKRLQEQEKEEEEEERKDDDENVRLHMCTADRPLPLVVQEGKDQPWGKGEFPTTATGYHDVYITSSDSEMGCRVAFHAPEAVESAGDHEARDEAERTWLEETKDGVKPTNLSSSSSSSSQSVVQRAWRARARHDPILGRVVNTGKEEKKEEVIRAGKHPVSEVASRKGGGRGRHRRLGNALGDVEDTLSITGDDGNPPPQGVGVQGCTPGTTGCTVGCTGVTCHFFTTFVRFGCTTRAVEVRPDPLVQDIINDALFQFQLSEDGWDYQLWAGPHARCPLKKCSQYNSAGRQCRNGPPFILRRQRDRSHLCQLWFTIGAISFALLFLLGMFIIYSGFLQLDDVDRSGFIFTGPNGGSLTREDFFQSADQDDFREMWRTRENHPLR